MPAAIALASRVYSLAVLAALDSLPGMRKDLFSQWDAWWYLRIAQSGYHAAPVRGLHDFAFFPAWPLLVKIASLGVFPLDLTGGVLANALFVGAAVLIWRVLADRLSPAAATGGLALLAFAPSAYAFSLPYSEPLFLTTAALSLWAGSVSRWRMPAAALAMLARIEGAAVVAALLARAWLSRGRERRAALAAAVAGCAGFAVWWGFIAVLTHRPTGFLLGSPSWDGGGSGLTRIVTALQRPNVERLAWLGFLLVAALGALRLLRADLELAVFSLAAIAFALLPGGTVNSMPRYALSAFPAFGGLALMAQRVDRRLVVAIVVAFALSQIAFASWIAATAKGAAP